jgi:glycosyltransferase involved in cell wall biosynthesis
MTAIKHYPRVLVVALGRINAVDSYNNGLLLRNLFGDWPVDHIAQIYSSGDTGDQGYFGHYYKMGRRDRWFGRLFYALKSDFDGAPPAPPSGVSVPCLPGLWATLKGKLLKLVIDTGIYELIFRPRVSASMKAWVCAFQPDIILAQGYNLTFAALPLMLKRITGARLAFFCSDDWPTYLYAGAIGEPNHFRWLMVPVVRRAATRLLAATDIPLAFGDAMAVEYATRYGKPFIMLAHSDAPERFEQAAPVRVHPNGTATVMVIGGLNQFRWPLVLDLDAACALLEKRGLSVRIAVLSSFIDPEGLVRITAASHVDLLPDPGNEKLPGFLKGADLLFLAEGFDPGFVAAIRLSISTKAHLFMFSQRPILVYAHADTGIARDALGRGWAEVVTARDPEQLADAIRGLLSGTPEVQAMVQAAYRTACAGHSHKANRGLILEAFGDKGRGGPVGL